MTNSTRIIHWNKNGLLGWIILLVISLTRLHSFLLFHTIAELSSIVIALAAFSLVWNTRNFQENQYLQFIGLAFFSIATIDLVHTLVYKGMNIFVGYDANPSIQLWIAARFLQAISCLMAPIYLRRKFHFTRVFILYGVITAVIFALIFFWDVFPDCYIEGSGLTPFKIYSEYLISALLFISANLLWKNRQYFDPDILRLLIISIFIAIISELTFTFYTHVYGFSNMLGHLFKVLSFQYIYQAIVQTGIVNPSALLFYNMNIRQKELEDSHKTLQKRVDERTRELSIANQTLVKENAQRRAAEEQARAHLKNIQALREIDNVIISSQDVHEPLCEIIDKGFIYLKVDAVSIMLLDSNHHLLEYVECKGFHTDLVPGKKIPINDTVFSACLMSGQEMYFPDIGDIPQDFYYATLLEAENFVSYHCAPIFTNNRTVGVLEVFNRSRLDPGEEWKTFFTTLAGQAAIAIDNAMLFERMQTAYTNLQQAYDKTLEGWVQALAYRDKETEEHTQRVVYLTTLLAKRMGIPDEEMEHIRRGALLHDIGKMAIPDHILLKPGPLTDEERAIVEKHPLYAKDWLTPIEYLAPAIDIPYAHHERWDGSGYPLGLKGEEIPLAARIFALVDVWDAINADRPYRPAWPRKKALAYIQSQSGTHFDPKVAAAFFRLINDIEL